MFLNNKKYFKFFLTLFVLSILLISSNTVLCLNRLKEGNRLKSFSLKTLEGNDLDINKYSKGENVAIIFWGIPEVENYIDYSKEALKTLVGMFNEYKNKDFRVIAIYCPRGDETITGTEKNEISKLVVELDIPFPVLLDTELKIFDKLGVVAMPSFVLIDKFGIVKYILPGFPPDTADKIIHKEIINLLHIEKIGS